MAITDLITSTTMWTSIVIIFALLYRWWKKPHPNFPPMVRGVPILGVLPFLDSHYPQKTFKKWSLEMKSPIISVRMGNNDTIVLNTFEAVNQTLVKQSLKFAGRPSIFVYTQVANSTGYVLKDYDKRYKKLRNFGSRFFRKSFVSKVGADAVETTINEEVDILINELKKNGDKPLDIKIYIVRCALNIISAMVINKRFEYNDPQADGFIDKSTYLLSESEDASTLTLINLFPYLRYFPPFRRANETAKLYMNQLCSDFIDPLVDEHKESFDPDNLRDFIDGQLFENQRDENCFNNEEIRQSVRDVFMAATDTIATALAWVFLFYLYHPEHQKTLNDEIDQVLDRDGIPSLMHKDEMPFTFAFIQESSRFRPTNIMTYRKTKDTVQVMGYTIPKETTVWLNNYGIHQDADTWKDPMKFDPYRHIDENGKFIQDTNMVSFGAGIRICLGEVIARKELFMTFVKLLQSFRVTADLKNLPSLDEGYNNFMHSPLPYKVTLKER